jgi:hypothetical protein
MAIVDTSEAVRCSAWARSVTLDPGGTAGTPAGFVLVDWPLPWPRDINEVPDLAEVVGLARGLGLRVQGRVPTPGAPRRVSVYRSPDPASFTSYRHDEMDAGPGAGADLASALADLLSRPVDGTGSLGADPGEVRGEVLVCTHGRRDACCGSAGTVLFAALTAAAGSGAVTAERRVARTSHTGGHRFAPTVIILPEGTLWAFADADLIERVVTRSGPLDDIVPRYRGCAGLRSPAVQCVERAVLAEVGWGLLGSARSGEELGHDLVRLTVVDPSGGESVWEADVVPGRTMAVPDCGRPLDEARKTETELVVRGLQQVV